MEMTYEELCRKVEDRARELRQADAPIDPKEFADRVARTMAREEQADRDRRLLRQVTEAFASAS